MNETRWRILEKHRETGVLSESLYTLPSQGLAQQNCDLLNANCPETEHWIQAEYRQIVDSQEVAANLGQVLWRVHFRNTETNQQGQFDHATTDKDAAVTEMLAAKQSCQPGHEHWIEPDPAQEIAFIEKGVPAPKVEPIGNVGCNDAFTGNPTTFICVNRFGEQALVGRYLFSRQQARLLHELLTKAIFPRNRAHLSWSLLPPCVGANIYRVGDDGEINYDVAVASVKGTSWTSGVLDPGAHEFAVQAFDESGDQSAPELTHVIVD